MRQAKIDQRFRIVNEGGVATVLVYDEIGLWGITAQSFAEELNAAGNVSEIKMHINSPGGDVFDGLAIYNTLAKHKASVSVEIDGVAASIASVVAMAGDEVTIAENAMMMIHDPWTVTMGDANDMRKTAELLDRVKGSIVATYERKTARPIAEIEDAMAAETWFTSADAIEFGLADTVLNAEPVKASVIREQRERLRNHFSAPKAVRPPGNWVESREYAIKIAEQL